MQTHNTHVVAKKYKTAPLATTVALCCLLANSGCKNQGDTGYREVTAADVANPVTTTLDNNPTPQPTPGPPSPPLPTGNPAEIDPITASAIDPPAKPSADPKTVTEPVNPLRPALPEDRVGRQPQPPGQPLSQPTTPATPAKPREIKLLIKERSFPVVGPDKALRVSYDDFDLLKVLNMDPVPPTAPARMPGWLKQLDGKRIRVRGFMYPTFQDPVAVFVLARDNQICCFGRNPKIYDLVKVALRKGVTSPYIQNRPFDVVGRFHIANTIQDGRLLYSIDDAIVVDR